jgi:serine/threonine protein kinase
LYLYPLFCGSFTAIDVFFYYTVPCRYLAPEYFMYGKVTDRVDVYALGVVLLELLSGRKSISSDGSSPKGQESLVMWVRVPSDHASHVSGNSSVTQRKE